MQVSRFLIAPPWWVTWLASSGLCAAILWIDWITYEIGWRQRVVFHYGWLDDATYVPVLIFAALLIWRLFYRRQWIAGTAAILLQLPLFAVLWFIANLLYRLRSGLAYF